MRFSFFNGLRSLFLVDFPVNCDPGDAGNEDANADGYEDEASLGCSKGVRSALEDEREGGEEEEEDGEGECSVKREEEHHGLISHEQISIKVADVTLEDFKDLPR